ncbi:hypothetical protein JK358_35550 [Nocardia sp. 2]|uniref:MarR family transcriptional regulator n=1 Tax=Nocardia acididurans TaxID=2802282 RepID=A0ABS1MGE0_9NOCA|nr:hypothetical protein [Nocardia acididurans]MBL1079730.1 hypothetical protein [Nocardia acididurans]
MAARTPKALAAWKALNDRQQGTLAAVYSIEAEREASRKRQAAQGDWDATPAAIWRRIDFAHDPSDRKLFGWTELQMRLSFHGWDNQGNGATMAALADRGLITRDQRATTFGRMHTVALTREGRAAARAGTTLRAVPAPKAVLSARSWEVLAQLWAADQRGEALRWGYSKTIEFVLIDKHVPPLAAHAGADYVITDRGRDFYREHYAAHVTAHPDIRAPHPDGAAADPWPARADDILTQHRRYYQALCEAWKQADTDRRTAQEEAETAPGDPDPLLPADVAAQAAARHQLWRDTARQRAEIADAHARHLSTRAERVARAYAVAALAAHRAAVTRANPLDQLTEPEHTDEWDEQRLTPPLETGIHAIDSEADKLFAAAIGRPRRRRGPAPTPRRPRLITATSTPTPPPGSELAALARFLHEHTRDGVLLRRLHPGS